MVQTSSSLFQKDCTSLGLFLLFSVQTCCQFSSLVLRCSSRLWRTSDLFRVYPVSHLMVAVTGFSLHVTLKGKTTMENVWMNEWMHVLWVFFILFYFIDFFSLLESQHASSLVVHLTQLLSFFLRYLTVWCKTLAYLKFDGLNTSQKSWDRAVFTAV